MKKYLFILGALTVFIFIATNVDAQVLRYFTSAQLAPSPQDGYILSTNGATSTWIANTGGGGGASSTIIKLNGTVSNTGVPTLDFGTGLTISESPTDEFNISGTMNDAGSYLYPAGNEYIEASYFQGTSTTATSSFVNAKISQLQAINSAGFDFHSNNGTKVAIFGAGGGANTTLYGGVNVDGATRLATSLTGLLYGTSGAVSSITNGSTGQVLMISGGVPTWSATSSLGISGGSGTVYLATTTGWTIGQAAYVASNGAIGSVATGTLTDSVTGLSFDNQTRGLFGGAAALSLDTGYSIPLTNSLLTANSSTTGNLAFWSGNQTLGNVATGTLTETVSGLELNATRSLIGGSAILALSSGFIIPTTTLWTNVADFYTTPSTRITAGTGLSWSGNTLNASGVGTVYLATTTGWTVGQAAYAASNGAVGSVATGTLTTTATGLQFDNSTRGLFGGPAILSLTAGFGIPSTTLLTSASSFFASPSSLCVSITGSAALCDGSDDGAGGGGGSLSTTTDIVGDGVAATVSYVTTDVMFGGSASTTSEFLFDKDGSKFFISSSSAQATTTLVNTNNAAAIQFGVASTSQLAAPIVRGIHMAFQSTTQVILNAVGTVTDLVVKMNMYLATGYNFFVGSTKWNNGDFIEGAAIASSTIASSSLKTAGYANDYYLTASSTAAGGLSWKQLLVNLTSQVTGILPVANGGTGTSTAALLYKPTAIQITSGSAAITTGDGKAYFRIPKEYNGMNLVDVDVAVTSSSTTGYLEFQLARGRQASAGVPHTFSDMLSTSVTIDNNEYDSLYSATTTVINGSNDDVLDGDLIRIDVDRVGSGPTAVVIVQPVFALP